MISVRIQRQPFSLAEEEQTLQIVDENCGALVAFQGMVRGKDQLKPLAHLFLEHYPNVTEAEIGRIIEQAKKRWEFSSCLVIHRVGLLAVGEPIVLVLVTAQHRKEAFFVAEFVMDYLKTQAPFWKKEIFVDGTHQWVEAKDTDVQEAEKWS